MALSFKMQFKKGQLSKALESMADPIAEAATEALWDAADQAKAKGRESIASAGFSRRWQNTLRADVFSGKGVSLNAAAIIYHKIPYADVFESGAQIRGKPMLWAPLSHTPKRLAYRPLTAERYATEVGDLFPIKKGRTTLLAAKMKVPLKEARQGPPYRVRMSALLRGGKTGGTSVPVMVPLFVGVPVVNIKKKFAIGAAVKEAADSLPQFYLNRLKAEK